MKQFILRYISKVFSPSSLAVAVTVGLLSISTNAFATNTSVAGGSGGTSYTLSCGSDKALVGIKGVYGSYVTEVQGVCAHINYDGSWQGDTSTTGSVGGFREKDLTWGFDLTCPNGYAVSGIKGKADWYIDQLRVRCGVLGQDGRLSSLGNFIGVAGGTGGSDFGPLDCSSNQPARLIRGKAGAFPALIRFVDSMGLGCEYVNTLKLRFLRISPSSVRVGQTSSATVRMSLTPAATATVSLTSSNTSVATATVSSISVGSSTTDGTASIRTSAIGCATITASYKGSSDSRHLLVHSATSPYLSLTTPDQMGSTATVTATIPSPAPAGGTTIKLTSLDKLFRLSIKDAVSMPASIVIPQGGVSLGFPITALKEGCVRIKASGNGGEVTHAIMVQ